MEDSSRTHPKKPLTRDMPSKNLLVQRFSAFVTERHPFAVELAVLALIRAMERIDVSPDEAESLERLRPLLRESLRECLATLTVAYDGEVTPGRDVEERLRDAADGLLDDCDGFLYREAMMASLTRDEKREMLRGMMLTRATDNQLKSFFMGGEVRYGTAAFQGKGFRSLGQEAIYAAPLRLHRGARFRGGDGEWRGDVVAPLIRDLGAALAMSPDPDTVFMVLNAQMGKAGPPMAGKDFHIGDWSRGVLPASAPLSISSLTVAGLAMAFRRREEGRVAVSFIGEGGASLGEWHEAINVCAAHRLPAIFCLENNQTALSTPVREQTAARMFADKASGYGIPGLTVDGTDPEAIAAAFCWAAERARNGLGPALIELVSMRMCGHAHHDDMLYLGHEPQPGWDYPELEPQGYADAELFRFWSRRDPIPRYAAKLVAEGTIDYGEIGAMRQEVERLVAKQAARVVDAPWPEPEEAGGPVLAGEPARRRVEVLDDLDARRAASTELPPLDAGPEFDRKGQTFLDAVMRGVGDAMRADPRVFVYGEDVGGRYGNAFLLLRPLLSEFGERIVNSPLSEGGVLGVCIGAALAGERPIGEIQFNDFVATGFNQLVNNAAKIRYRWGGEVPMVVRMPWGGLRRAGPYHSQNTEPWFYRVPGIKIVAPSTPHDARALLMASVQDPDPVLFYEHIALYRDPRVKQRLDDAAPDPLPLGRAALRRAGSDLAIVTYGAYVHVCMRVAEKLAGDGIGCAVLDLRSLAPLDRDALLQVARHCGKLLVVQEDSRTGSIGESLAAIVQEEAFEHLDAPIRVLGALDAPVPYSPPLEDAFILSEDDVERAARRLVEY